MSKLLTAGLVAIGLVVGASAQAGGNHYSANYGYGYGHGHGGYGYRSYGYYGDIGDEILIGAAIIGGAILLGNLLSRPQYRPAPVYAAPVCTRNQVYRYLPDGRIQWGTRTRCY